MESFQKAQAPLLQIMSRPTSSSPSNPASSRPTASPTSQTTSITSPRSLHQLSIYFLGSACLLASTALTRKAIWRRHLRLKPPFYNPNTNPHEYFSPFSDACQALNLATMNCVSVGIMALGGAMWTFDIANLREARAVLRKRLGYQRIYEREEDVPNTIAEMIRQSGEMRVVDDEGKETKDQ